MIGQTRSHLYGTALSPAPLSENLTPVTASLEKSIEDRLADAVSGVAPFDVSGTWGEVLSESSLSRLSRYKELNDFYDGKQFADHLTADGYPKRVYNFCAMAIKKHVAWLSGKSGWRVVASKGNEQVAALLNKIWDRNDRELLTEQVATASSVTGDGFFYVSIGMESVEGHTLPPDKWHIKLGMIRPEHCFPVWTKNGRWGDMEACVIQMPMNGVDKQGVPFQLYTMYITRTSFTVYYDTRLEGTYSNPFGRVNVVHVPNAVDHRVPYGISELLALRDVNVSLNEVVNMYSMILDYHAEPTTIIYGSKVSGLEKGADRVWSGFPTDARVENLEVKSDHRAVQDYISLQIELLSKLAGIPEVAWDSKNFSLTNTSGLAMQMLFQPLLEKVNNKRKWFTLAVKRVNELILIGCKNVLNVNLDDYADDMDCLYDTGVEYSNMLPRDVQAELDQAVKKQTMGIWSQAELIRRFGDVEDTQRLAVELTLDDLGKHMQSLNAVRAAEGTVPLVSATVMSSLASMDDLEKLVEYAERKDQEIYDASLQNKLAEKSISEVNEEEANSKRSNNETSREAEGDGNEHGQPVSVSKEQP